MAQDNKAVALNKELASRVLARRNLLFFIKKFHPSYEAGWVHEDICRRLEKFSKDVTEQKAPRLMLLMPPRHGKSEIASIRFPAWHLGHHPEHEVINCGYNTDLPMKFSRKVREMMRDKAYQAMFDGTKLDPDSQSVEAWNTTAGGGFTAAGVGGGITGKGAHVLIIDDPIKNMEESDSAVTRETLWDWYWSTAYTRLAPGAGVLVIQTWWNDDDLAGRLQKQMRENPDGDQFVIIKYPALAEQDEFLSPEGDLFRTLLDDDNDACPPEGSRLLRVKGEALHTKRYPTKAMENYRANMHPRIWSALYQQNPVPDEGMYFKTEWFRSQPTLPAIRKRNLYQAWDFAIGEKQQNDYTVGSTILQDENNFLHVLDIVRFKGDTFVIIEAILDFYEKWSLYPDTPVTLGVEDGQIWRAIQPVFLQRCAERNKFPAFEVLKPLTDKLVRARAFQGRMQQGRVIFQEGPWLHNLKRELLRFPAGEHDDQCFVAGTKVLMWDGSESDIVNVRAGDYVMTPVGVRLVTNAVQTSDAAQVYEAEFSDGTTLIATSGHPIATDRGWVALADLTESDRIHAIESQDSGESSCQGSMSRQQQTSSGLSSMGGCTGATQTRPENTSLVTSVGQADADSCTETSGSTTTGPYQKGTRFTMWMATTSTTLLRIWSACCQKLMRMNMQSSGESLAAQSSSASTSKRFDTRLQRGIARLKAWSGIGSTEEMCGNAANSAIPSVSSAELASSQSSLVHSSAPNHVRTSTGEPRTLSMTRRNALGVQPVYNISVEEAECYYANGVLVHNCDSISWACNMIVNKAPPKPDKPVSNLKSWRDSINKLSDGSVGHMAA